jgi:uracil phosphoribosyltransferase
MVNILGSNNSVLNVFLAEVRDGEIQKDRMRFRRNMERLGEIFAYEISKTLPYQEREVLTTLGSAQVMLPTTYPVLATILRAGLPLHQGLLNYFDRSENAFVSAFRKPYKNGSFKIELEYVSCPDIEGRVLILCDTMLATGASILLAYKTLLTKGKPAHTHFVSVLGSQEGVEFLKRNIPQDDVTIWVGAVDDELTAQAFIVPGLGDAGDLAFGSKYEGLI